MYRFTVSLTVYPTIYQGDGSSRAITGQDFFRRHPALHPVITAHLKTAVERLEAGDAGHPSLFPVLALISRLRCRALPHWVRASLSALTDLPGRRWRP